MSLRAFRRRKARRALGFEPVEDQLAPKSSAIEEDLTVRGLVTHGLAAFSISVLGLAVAGSVALTASAQSTEVSASATAVEGSFDQTRAVPAPESQRMIQEQAAINDQQNAENGGAVDGALEAFGRAASDGTSRNAVRAELDRAVANQNTRERSASLELSGEKAYETSGIAMADARSTNLVDATNATKREQARLAEEKRKAEEALKAAAAAAAAPAPAQGALSAPAAAPAAANPAPQIQAAMAPAASGGVTGQGATPIAPGAYTLGARFGAVGAWSRYHTGQDLPAPIGTPIRAASGGVVVSPTGGGWAGTHVVIRHGDGSATLYAHMSSAQVHPGQTVQAGQQIGAVGMTGRTFGPHLHFEHYPSGEVGNPYSADDPYSWLLRMGVRL